MYLELVSLPRKFALRRNEMRPSQKDYPSGLQKQATSTHVSKTSSFLVSRKFITIKSRDGLILKFQPIPILEFLCQPIRILKFQNYLYQLDLSETFTINMNKLHEPSAQKRSRTTLFFGFPIFHTSLSYCSTTVRMELKKMQSILDLHKKIYFRF